MTIERNGEKIELTREEIRLAGEENDRYYLKEDIRGEWVDIHGGKECPYSDEELEEIVYLAKHNIDSCDNYYDLYWMCIDDAISSFVEEEDV